MTFSFAKYFIIFTILVSLRIVLFSNFLQTFNLQIKKLNLYLSILFLGGIIFSQCKKEEPEIIPNEKITCDLTYEQNLGNSWHFVGQSEYVNTYKGVYWVGESKTIYLIK